MAGKSLVITTRRKQEADARRRMRYASADTPRQQLDAAYDYLRSALRDQPDQKADELRTKLAERLIVEADQIRGAHQ